MQIKPFRSGLDAARTVLYTTLPLPPFVPQIVLSFTVRSVGKNRGGEESVGDRVLQLFLHSLGAILTSVQDTEMK